MKKIITPEVKKNALIVVSLLVFYYIFKMVKIAVQSVQKSASSVAIKTVTGLSNEDLQTSKRAALQAYDCIYNYSFGMFENERGFITALNTLQSAKMAKACSLFYKELPKKTSLKEDMLKYLQGYEQTDIKTLIRSNIQ